MIRLPQSYDEDFCSLLERLRSAYPAELFRLEGIHPDQLDINAVSRDYFKTSDRKGSATADHSIDPNANVSGRDVITFNYEVPKSLMKLNSLYNLWKTMKELYGRDDADQAVEQELNGTLYINDVWDIGRPYSYHPCTTIFIREGQNGNIRHLTMSMLFDEYREFVAVKSDYEEVNLKPFGLLVYEEGKWVKLERVLRHLSDVDLIRFETKKGNVFTVTEDHPCILSDDSEKKALAVELGDKIKSYPLGSLKKELDLPAEVDVDRAYTIGAMIGDGSVNWKECTFHQNDAMNSSYAPVFAKVYGELHIAQNGRGFKFGGVEDARWFIQNIGIHALNKHLPENYLNWASDAQQALLAGIIDTDGSVNKKTGAIDIRMISLAVIQQIAELATLLGFERIRTSLARNYQNDKSRIAQTQPLYRVSFVIPKRCLILSLSYKINQHQEVILRKRQKDGRFDTDEVLKKDTVSFKGHYVYDITTSTGKFYTNGIIAHNCFNFSTCDIALEGLNMGGRLTIDPPKSLNAFLRQVEQFTVYAANSTLGATGLADLLIVVSRYVDDILTTGYDHHIKIGKAPRVWTYVKESLTSLIYTLNWEFRGNQSPFTNVSVYDRHFLRQLVPAYLIGGTAPDIETVEKVQDLFLDAYNETLARTPITFPVVTACFSAGQGSDGGGRTIQDKAFLKKISRHNLKYGFINIYCGESSTLSSCCRLRSSISDLGYSNTFGAGSTKIGSLGVVTLNLPRLARTAEGSFPAFLGLLRQSTGMASRINHAKRMFIKDRIERGSLPLYTLGFMGLSRQYSTCGFTGLHEALSILGFDMLTEEDLQAAEDALTVINETNAKLSKLLGTPHNMEQVPAESSAVKLAKKDALLGLNPEGIPLYSNQFLPLWEEGADLLDRIRVQGRLDGHCTGGAICHLNVATEITDPAVMEALIHHAAASGAVYFAVNYQINRCAQGHMTVGRNDACPTCGAPVIDTFTRVVGFLTNTKHWNKTRREHDWPERKFAHA